MDLLLNQMFTKFNHFSQSRAAYSNERIKWCANDENDTVQIVCLIVINIHPANIFEVTSILKDSNDTFCEWHDQSINIIHKLRKLFLSERKREKILNSLCNGKKKVEKYSQR